MPWLYLNQATTGSLLVLSTAYHDAIQGDSGRKVNILARDSIGHYEKKRVHTSMCVILNGYRDTDTAVWIYTYSTIVNGNKNRNYSVLTSF
jgi:hypothetical protein